MKRLHLAEAPGSQWQSIFQILIGCGLALVLMSGATASESSALTTIAEDNNASSGLSTRQKRMIDAIFRQFVDKTTPGGAITIIERGKVLYEKGYGLCRLSPQLAITTKSLFHVGSVGKQFTALGIMQLKEKGLLDYDDPIGEYFDGLKRFGEQLTIRRLLNHTSGIADYDEDEDLYDAILTEGNGHPNNDDLIAVLSQQGDALFSPGEQFHYSNTGYDVLGALIEKLSGQTYADYMRDHIFHPAWMSATFALPNAIKRRNVCYSYTEDEYEEPKPDKTDPFDFINGSGSTYSSVEDFFQYDQALTKNILVSRNTLLEAWKPTKLNDGTLSKYGFAWDIETYRGRPMVAHQGTWLAFDSYYMRFRRESLSIFVTLNLDYAKKNAEEIAKKIADICLPEVGLIDSNDTSP